MPCTVLILGANGRFGAAAVHAFAAAGWQVLAQSRRPLAFNLPPGVAAPPLDLAAPDALAAAGSGARVVVQALNPPCTHWAEEALPLARQGMDLAQRLDALLMLPGNVCNFGAGMPACLRLDTPQAPTTDPGRLRCPLEDGMGRRAGQALRSVVVRAADCCCAGRGGWFDLVMVKPLRASLCGLGFDRPAGQGIVRAAAA